MFQELVNATRQLIGNQDFHPYQHGFNYPTGNGFEEYWNHRIRNVLIQNGIPGLNEVNHQIAGHRGRQFDLSWQTDDGRWNVCEFGHEKSSQGYLANLSGEIKDMGLINKWVSDYCRNYNKPNPAINLRSYSYLYFSFEEGYEIELTNEMFGLIIQSLPQNHNEFQTDVMLHGALVGRILIIDAFEDFEQIKALFQNNPQLHPYINLNERGWNKGDLLME